MSAGPKEIWKTFKQDIKEGNAKVKADYKRDVEAIKASDTPEQRKSDQKKAWTLFGLVLSLPLFLFGLGLLVVGIIVLASIF